MSMIGTFVKRNPNDKKTKQKNETIATLFISILGIQYFVYMVTILVRFILCGWNCDFKYGKLERNGDNSEIISSV